MQALQIEHHGALSELRIRELPRPATAPDQVSVAIEAAAINPSDLMSVEGRFPHAPLPRIVGRDFAGRISDGPSELIGVAVWGSGGDLGISRDGSHADFLVLPRAAVARRPHHLSPAEAAACGVPFVTAWTALVELGAVQAGEWVIISGAAGAVGSAALQVARARGAQVIALIKDHTERAAIEAHEGTFVAQSDRNDLAEVVQAATGGQGAALALNAVGGTIFQPLLDGLADGGRMVVFSAAAGREVALDLFAFYRRRLTLRGLNTAVVDVVQSALILDQLTPLFEAGALRPPAIAAQYALSQAPEAYARVAQGVPGKVILLPDRPAQT